MTTAAVRAGTCPACGASVRFIAMPSGAWMPCDSVRRSWWILPRAPRGQTVAVVVLDTGQVLRGAVSEVATPETTEVSGFTPHWASCSEVERFRTARRRARRSA